MPFLPKTFGTIKHKYKHSSVFFLQCMCFGKFNIYHLSKIQKKTSSLQTKHWLKTRCVLRLPVSLLSFLLNLEKVLFFDCKIIPAVEDCMYVCALIAGTNHIYVIYSRGVIRIPCRHGPHSCKVWHPHMQTHMHTKIEVHSQNEAITE